MNKSIVRRKVPDAIVDFGSSELINRIYSNRGMLHKEEADLSISGLLPFRTLKNIEQACARVYEALVLQQSILIVGDFDADGATSTTIAMRLLRAFGAKNVAYLLPDRFKFGYGLTAGIVDEACLNNKPDLIITVDNGISSIAGVLQAEANGIDVLITDHHLPGEQVPATIILNPNQHGDVFPSKNLAGVGVIFYLMCALRSYLRDRNYFVTHLITEPVMVNYLDVVALGTVADVVPLDRNNRILVRQGLNRIRSGQACPGIQALCMVSGRDAATLTSTDLGFALGPRINAAGRIDDMRIGVECLLSDNLDDALFYATKLHELNLERRVLEAEMQIEALDAVATLHMEKPYPAAVCLFGDTWHQGIVGLVASRIKEKIYRPVIAFASHTDGLLKGSGRSIPGLHLRDVLADMVANNSGLIDKFGGHAMAVGLTIKQENFPEFQEIFNSYVAKKLDEVNAEPIIYTDGELSYTELSLRSAYEIRTAGPWGQAFPQPLFDGIFRIIEQRVVGERHLKLRLMPEGDSRQILDAIAFGVVDGISWPNHRCEKLRIAYELDVNVFNGRENLQLMVQHLEPAW
jgi:single-stranded-DNA-specific exonuclease